MVSGRIDSFRGTDDVCIRGRRSQAGLSHRSDGRENDWVVEPGAFDSGVRAGPPGAASPDRSRRSARRVRQGARSSLSRAPGRATGPPSSTTDEDAVRSADSRPPGEIPRHGADRPLPGCPPVRVHRRGSGPTGYGIRVLTGRMDSRLRGNDNHCIFAVISANAGMMVRTAYPRRPSSVTPAKAGIHFAVISANAGMMVRTAYPRRPSSVIPAKAGIHRCSRSTPVGQRTRHSPLKTRRSDWRSVIRHETCLARWMSDYPFG